MLLLIILIARLEVATNKYSNTSYVAINPSIYQGFFFYYNL